MTTINSAVKTVALNTANTSSLTAQQEKLQPAASKDLGKVAQTVGQKIGDLFEAARVNKAVSNTQAGQLHQVADGLRKGTLNAQEAETILKSQQEFNTKLRSANSDGKLTAKEQIELQLVQQNLQKQIDAAVKGPRSLASVVAGLDKSAGRQAAQLDKLADGLAQGNVTRNEAGTLLRQQAEIADARGDADSVGERVEVGSLLNKADKTLESYSKPGSQQLVKARPFGVGAPIGGVHIGVPVKG